MNSIAKIILLIGIISIIVSSGFAQTYRLDTVRALIIGGRDTVPYIALRSITVYPQRVFKNDAEYKQYTRLMYNVKKVYPYSKLIKNKVYELNGELQKLKTEKERKLFLKYSEKVLRDQFEKELISLSINQGRILMKLVDRETGVTTYELVKEFKGTFSAIFFQGIARIFGSNLKAEYNAKGEDSMIEEIIARIENGQL